ncbi:MAG TPA: hypothetical protein VEC17_01800, partial [Candidatus Binatia bacterium]|nr:hypothetical protein [Candidatus Binatia bacterium]
SLRDTQSDLANRSDPGNLGFSLGAEAGYHITEMIGIGGFVDYTTSTTKFEGEGPFAKRRVVFRDFGVSVRFLF